LAREREGQGAKVPGSELARILLADSLRGANWPGSEKARYPGTVGEYVNLTLILTVGAGVPTKPKPNPNPKRYLYPNRCGW